MEKSSESAGSMLQLIGIVVIADSLLVAGWWVVSGRPRLGPLLFVCCLAVIAGLLVLMLDRATAATVKEVTAIKDAAEKAAADAVQIAEFKRQAQTSRDLGPSIAAAAAEAARQVDEIKAKNAAAAKELLDLDEAIRKASITLAELEARADGSRNFSDVARLNLIGRSSGENGKGGSTPISQALEGTYEIAGTRATYKEDPSSEQVYRGVIARFPRFPFAYWALADILKRRGDPSWKGYAQIAENVLRKTTQVPMHDPGHDNALKAIERMLAQDRAP